MKDITIGCIQCGREFVFTAAEQLTYKNRNFSAPRRCPACRRNKAKVDPSPPDSKNRNRRDEEGYL